jgi:hypothetical protein
MLLKHIVRQILSENKQLKVGDEVWISHQDIDGIGYGDSVNTDGIIVGGGNGTYYVEYKDEYFHEKTRGKFYDHELRLLNSMNEADEAGNVEIDKKMTEKTLEDTFSVTDAGLNYINRELDRLNKKASRLGLEPLTLKVLGKKEEKQQDGDMRVTHQVKIEGKSPIVGGYEFIANIEHTDAGNIINISPNSSLKNLPDEYRKAGATCDHCHTKRDRNNTFVLKDVKTGDLKRVGRNCLKNFMPDVDPKNILTYAAVLEKALNVGVGAEDMDDGGGSGGGGSSSKYYDASSFFVFICIAYYMTGKYISKSKARENDDTSTADLAMNLRFSKDSETQDEIRKLWPRAEELAKKIEEWKDTKDWDALADQKPEMSNYFQNMKIISRSQAIQYKNAGYHASLLAVYLRDQADTERVASQKTQAANKTYLGKIGEKITFDATVKVSKPFQSQYGTGEMYVFNDPAGNEVVYFASNDMGFEVGQTYKLQATVKNQQVSKYNQQPQTIITRAKLVGPDAPKKEPSYDQWGYEINNRGRRISDVPTAPWAKKP